MTFDARAITNHVECTDSSLFGCFQNSNVTAISGHGLNSELQVPPSDHDSISSNAHPFSLNVSKDFFIFSCSS